MKANIFCFIFLLQSSFLLSQDCYDKIFESLYPNFTDKIQVKLEKKEGAKYAIFYAPKKKCFGETDKIIFWNKDSEILMSIRNTEENCFGKMKFQLSDDIINMMKTKQIDKISFNDSMMFEDSFGVFTMTLELLATCVAKE